MKCVKKLRSGMAEIITVHGIVLTSVWEVKSAYAVEWKKNLNIFAGENL